MTNESRGRNQTKDDHMKRFFMRVFLLIGLCFGFFSNFGPAMAEDQQDLYNRLVLNAAGRYFTADSEGVKVLELIPAFGRLFASVGYYFQEDLYSYYMAELTPFFSSEASESGFEFSIRFFSNLSYAGNYWPGETIQRLTLIQNQLILGNYRGDGDALISKGTLILTRNDELPSLMIYDRQFIEMIPGYESKSILPENMEGNWQTNPVSEKTDGIIQIKFEPDGTMWLLRNEHSGFPPQLYKGIYEISESDGGQNFCYLLSSPASGTMPFTGCAGFQSEKDSLVFLRSEDSYEELLVPEADSSAVYRRLPR